MTPVLSVVVPAYNVAEYLPACLDSLLDQTLRDLEVIVVDDASPDECGEIADSYAARDPRVVVLHTQNQGVGPARNTGVAAARGRYLAFVDSDDLVPARAFELMVNTLEATGSDFVAGNAWRYMPDGELLPSWTHQEAFGEDHLRVTIRDFPPLAKDRMMWNKVYRRSFWDEHGYEFPAMRYEDYPVALATHLDASAVDVISTKVYLWRQRRESTSITQRSADVDNVADRVTSAEMILDMVDGRGDARIRDVVHAYLVDVDVVSVADAYASAAESEKAEIGPLLTRLAARLEPKGTNSISRAIHARALRGDFAGVSALSTFRAARGGAAKLKAVRHPGMTPVLPRLLAGYVTHPRDKSSSLLRRRLRSDLLAANVVDDAVELAVRLRLREDVARRVRLSASCGGRPVGVRRSGAQDIVVAVPGRSAHESSPIVLRARLGPLTWEGPITAKTTPIPMAVGGSSGLMGFSTTEVGDLTVSSLGSVDWVDVDLTERGVEVRPGRSSSPDTVDGAVVAVLRSAPSPAVIAPIRSGEALLAWDDLLHDDPPDNPMTRESFRALVIADDAADLPHTARPVYTDSTGSIALPEHTVRLSRGTDGSVGLLVHHA